MPHIPRNKKRDSDRSGFNYKQIRLVKDKRWLVGPDEYDVPPPSSKSLGGEGEVSGNPRLNSATSYATPTELEKQTRFITAAGGISFSPDYNEDDRIPVNSAWIFIAGSNQTVNVTSVRQVSAGAQGNQLTLECVGSSVILENGSGLSLRSTFTMDSGAILNLIYSATDNLWHETSRSHRTKNLGAF